ncbi:NAD(P)H-dependent flavin oxidoreductase [Xylophilus sp.]|uniref:NAD(P)H-dependent flavin oxidoreductase n=1 Tax=Xylophilus sp. TaxID=2653893 RepID=UPI0013BE750F|nr:nitronate monooxygenase [Xylophilus sp.]KAF1045413.1 MAG: putative monooxygenase [Xylophilus sp.]
MSHATSAPIFVRPTIAALFGTRLPIVQAPMAGVQGVALAAAVSRAGALGSLPAAALTADALRQELAVLREAADGHPFNVNFFAHTTPPADDAQEAAWRTTLAPYYAGFGIDIAAVPAGAGRQPFGPGHLPLLDAVRPPVVSFHFGLPDETLLAPLHAWGTKIIASATTVEEALWLERRGVDAVIAQGLEAGGHRGWFLGERDPATQIGTFALVPQVVRAVDVPVIAAGGIADAAGVAAAFALGAAGVQAGTAYLLADEATTSAVHRAALQSDAARQTVLTTLFTGGTARGIVNRAIRELGALDNAAPPFPRATAGIAPLRAAAEKTGSGDFSPLWSGQNASVLQAAPAAEITRALAAGLPAPGPNAWF